MNYRTSRKVLKELEENVGINEYNSSYNYSIIYLNTNCMYV